MSRLKQVDFAKPTPCPTLSFNLLGMNLVVILGNEKISKTKPTKLTNLTKPSRGWSRVPFRVNLAL